MDMASDRLGERLVHTGVITQLQWQEALRREGGGRSPALLHLARMGVPGAELADAIGLPVAGGAQLDSLDPDVLSRISSGLAREHWALPVRYAPGALAVAMADPFDERALEEIAFFTGAGIEPLAIDPNRLEELLDAHFEVPESQPLGAIAMKMKVPPAPVDDPVPASLRGVDTDEIVEPASGELAALFGTEEPFELLTRKPPDEHATILPPPTPSEPPEGAGFVSDGELLGSPEPPNERPTLEGMPPVLEEESHSTRITQEGMPPVPSVHERPTATSLAPVEPERPRAPPPPAPQGGFTPAAPPLGGTPPALEPSPEQAAAALGLVRTAEGRDRICEAALSYLALYFPRVAIFRVRGESIEGWSSGGELHHSTVDGIDIPREATTFHRVIHTRTVHLGPLVEAVQPLVLWEALDDRPPRIAGIVPVEIKDRVVTLLYGDSPDDRPVVATVAMLAELAAEAGEGFRRLILLAKLGGD